MKIRRKYVIALLAVLALVVAGSAWAYSLNRGTGAWVYDEASEVWYQDVAVAPASQADAKRARDNNRGLLESLPGVSEIGAAPLSSGPWAGSYGIEVRFASAKERDAAMRRDLVPPELDGVPVIVDNKPGVVRPAG